MYGTKKQQRELLNTLVVELIDCESLELLKAIKTIALMHLDSEYWREFRDDHNVKRLEGKESLNN